MCTLNCVVYTPGTFWLHYCTTYYMYVVCTHDTRAYSTQVYSTYYLHNTVQSLDLLFSLIPSININNTKVFYSYVVAIFRSEQNWTWLLINGQSWNVALSWISVLSWTCVPNIFQSRLRTWMQLLCFRGHL